MKYIGFLLLAFTAILLMVFTLIFTISESLLLGILLAIFFMIGAFVIARVGKETIHAHIEKYPWDRIYFFQAVSVSLGAFSTYLLSVHLNLGAVLASALIGILAVLIIKPYAVPIFCGSFAGMSHPEVFGMVPMIWVSIGAGIIYLFAVGSFNGYGGKLGTIAFASGLIVWLFLSTDFMIGASFEGYMIMSILIVSVLGASLTYLISIKLKKGPVMASGIVGVIAFIAFSLFFNQHLGVLATAMFGASFVGMSQTKRMPSYLGIMIAGLLFGAIFILSAPYFNGVGGKLGTIALISIMGVSGAHQLLKRLTIKDNVQTKNRLN